MAKQSFQQWYAGWAKKLGLNPDPDAPEHYYDYRAAYRVGTIPDKSGHWPSKFKLKGHPTYHLKNMAKKYVSISEYAAQEGYKKYFQREGTWYARRPGGIWQATVSKEAARSVAGLAPAPTPKPAVPTDMPRQRIPFKGWYPGYTGAPPPGAGGPVYITQEEYRKLAPPTPTKAKPTGLEEDIATRKALLTPEELEKWGEVPTPGALAEVDTEEIPEEIQTQVSETQAQIADLQAQQDALTQYGLTDTDQLTKDASGNYVPIGGDTYDTGNDTLDQILQTFQDTLNAILDQGQIVNPKVDITPDILQGFIDQASAELDPYYKSQFEAIKGDLSTDLTYLSDQYSQAIKSQEAQFTQALATQREAEAGAGTIFSGARRTREEALGQVAERGLAGLGTSLAYQAGKAGTAAERTIGSLGLGGLTPPTWTPYGVSTAGEGRYTALGGRQLFTPTGGITGTLEREQIEKKRAYSDLLKSYWLEEQAV